MSTQLVLTQTSSHTFVCIENWFTTFLIKYTWHSFSAKQFVDSPINYNEYMLHCWHWNAAVNLRFMLLQAIQICVTQIYNKQIFKNISNNTLSRLLNKHVVTMSTQLALTQTSSHTFVCIEHWFTTFLIKYTWHSFTAKQFVDSPIKYNECMLHCWHWNAAVNLRFMLL